MKNGSTYFKYGSLLAIVIILVWFLNDLGCGRKGGTKIEYRDTIKVKIDTFYTDTNTTVTYVPRPYKIETTRDSIIYLERQPEYQDFPPIAKRWIEDYHTKKYYDTTISIQYGTLNIKDTVYKNKIVGRKTEINQLIPKITKTITLSEKPRTVAYWGFSIAGNVSSPIAATEFDFGLKLKNNSYIGLKGMLLKDGQPLYGIQYMRAIRLRK